MSWVNSADSEYYMAYVFKKQSVMITNCIRGNAKRPMNTMTLAEIIISIQKLGCSAVLGFAIILYILYQRFFHPLARYPGPLWASLSNSWKAYYVYRLTIHERLIEAHRYYGPIVRIGPNDLHFWDGEAIAPIYKAGRSMTKTEFYDAFTAFSPNLFGGRNEEVGKSHPWGFRADYKLSRFTLSVDDSFPMAFRRPQFRTWRELLMNKWIS